MNLSSPVAPGCFISSICSVFSTSYYVSQHPGASLGFKDQGGLAHSMLANVAGKHKIDQTATKQINSTFKIEITSTTK